MTEAGAATDLTIPLWRQAFRPFFLAGSLFSVAAISLWVAVLAGAVNITPYGNILFWHAHEMLFGFVGAIVVGFLLTAVQNWTGIRATHGKPLQALFALWLAARIVMLTGVPGHPWIVFAIDLSFYPVAAILFSILLIRSGNKRNYQITVMLLFLTAANLLTHISVLCSDPSLFLWGMNAGIFVVTLLMIVMGGRVIPMFTANGAGVSLPPPIPWLEAATLLSGWLLAVIYLLNIQRYMPHPWIAAIFTIASLCNTVRAFRWRIWTTFTHPLVWSLQVAYGFIPAGFGLWALHYAGFDISRSAALHSLTAGAMGTLILAMIARVSLGHTGRPLLVGRIVSVAFFLIVSAGVLRILSALFPAGLGFVGLCISALCWALAYVIYLAVYYPILTAPRADGRPG